MDAKIDPTLRSWLEKVAAVVPDRRYSFILTLALGTDPATLAGLQLTHSYAAISAVAGTATAVTALILATLPQVERVERDGEMWALEGDN